MHAHGCVEGCVCATREWGLRHTGRSAKPPSLLQGTSLPARRTQSSSPLSAEEIGLLAVAVAPGRAPQPDLLSLPHQGPPSPPPPTQELARSLAAPKVIECGDRSSLPTAQMRTPRPRKHRVVAKVTKTSEWRKHGSHAGGLPDTPCPPRPPTPPPPGLPAGHPLKSSSVSQTCQGWGWCRRFPVWAQREGAERGKEEGAASSHKRLQRARASAKRASTAQGSQPGAWAPGPAPALRPRPFILGLPPRSAGHR